jgi:diguanylate cyclase (GGDEF)-like protein/PAS domain S-box-containing protein
LHWNAYLERISGYSCDEVREMTALDFFEPVWHPVVQEAIDTVFATGSACLEVPLRTKGGGSVPLYYSVQRIDLEGGPCLIGVGIDISDRNRAEARIHQLAYYDDLTGLRNRAGLLEFLREHLEKVRGQHHPVALLLVNVRRFREINEALGYETGDHLLQGLGSRLSQLVPREAVVARNGGDEYAIVAPKIDVHLAGRLAARIHEDLREPFAVDGLSIMLQTRIGIAIFPGHAQDPALLLQRADLAMHAATDQGAETVLYAPGLGEGTSRRVSLLGDLDQAITQEKLLLLYQPKVDLHQQRVIGAEALARWPHPGFGTLSPREFIPLSEHSGLVKPMTIALLKQALSDAYAQQWPTLALKISLNISPRNLEDPNFLPEVGAALSTWGLPAGSMVFEITESAFLGNSHRVQRALKELRAMGIELSIDDFGTGYSSLAYLRHLPIQELKIDRAFLLDLQRDDRNPAVVRAIIDLAHSMAVRVIAEGVEDQAMLQNLIELGCDGVQGYFIGRPVPAVEFTKWYRQCTWNRSGARQG